jgi:heat shock protein HslJ
MRRHPPLLLPLAVAAFVACASAPAAAEAATPDAAQLAAYHWQLAQATNHEGQRIAVLFVRPDKPLQLDFADGRVSVRNACNGMGGGYRIENGRLVVGPMMHTMMACADPALNRLDGLIGQRLASRPAITVAEHGDTPQLQLRTASGDTLEFTGVPTPETRYGGPGVTEFLEVAAHTVPCQQSQPCLNVREVHYDANGLKTGTPGEWHALPSIEGYTHQDGVHNILRVKRYAAGNAPAAYVLDTVVETRIPKL